MATDKRAWPYTGLASNELMQAYIEKFGGDIFEIVGPEYPELTTEVIEKALKDNKPVEPFPYDEGSIL